MINLRGVDLKAEIAGVWVDYHGVQLKIASADTIDYQAEMQAAMRKYKAIDYSDLRIQHKIMSGVVARSLLKDWKGVTDDGEEVQYTPEIGEQLLLEDYQTFKFVHDFAQETQHYKLEERKEIAGKSLKRSNGGRPGAKSTERSTKQQAAHS